MAHKSMKNLLKTIFKELDGKITVENVDRRESGTYLVPKCDIKILGQMSLLANDKISSVLHLAQTADMDALVTVHFVKTELKKILIKNGLIYDEDSEKVWLPPEVKFEELFEFSNILVSVIDPESALVSKAIKAAEKNKQLIREALASGKFKNLADRIEKYGGRLETFIGE
jgi:hypothetical protein